MRLLLLLLALAACGPLRTRTPSEPAGVDEQRAYGEIVASLPAFLEDGQVVCREEDGSPACVGDSVIRTGELIGLLKCEDAQPLIERLANRIITNDGWILRFEPLPAEYFDGNELSFDSETGVYFAFARHVARCGATPLLQQAWAHRQRAISAFDGRLHPNVEARVVAEFTLTRDAVEHALGLRGEPAAERLLVLEAQIAGWLEGVKIARAPCFRANLAWRHVRSLEALGYHISWHGTLAICTATDGLQIPTWEQWCGRSPGLSEFLAGFKPNEWEFRFQRCGAWETADGAGRRHLELDRLEALDALYRL